MIFKKTITTDFFTTLSLKQFIETTTFFVLHFFSLKDGKYTLKFEEKLLSFLGLKDSKIVSFYNGRTALYNTLKIIGVSKEDEVLVSGYNCISVSNAVLQTGANITYVDIETETLGINIDDLKKKITKNTKVIIVQHTFGIPAKIEEIKNMISGKDILIIEDTAHSLGSTINGNQTGAIGDFSIFSTGRDKVISSVTGGFLIINNEKYFGKVYKILRRLSEPDLLTIIKNLTYNLFGYIAYKTYDFFSLGKVIITLIKKFSLITMILTKEEKECNYSDFNYLLPNILSYLAYREIIRIDKYKKYKNELLELYKENLNENVLTLVRFKCLDKTNLFRLTMICSTEDEKNRLFIYMRNNKVLLGTSWSGTNIAPYGSDIEKAKYILGSCPVSEDISKRIINLPLHKNLTKKDILRTIYLLNNYYKSNV